MDFFDDDPPPAKKQRAAREFITFRLKDGAGHEHAATMVRSHVRRVPYLETLLTTGVGTQQEGETRRIDLPDGCTATAAAALLINADYKSSCARFSLDARTMDAAIALLRTADFLMMKDVIPDIVHQCHRNLRQPADLAKLLSIESASPEVQQMRQTLKGSAIVNAMSETQVWTMVSAMRGGDAISPAQSATLIGWLSVGGRTAASVNTVLSHMRSQTTYDTNRNGRGRHNEVLHNFFFKDHADTVKLKDGAVSLLEKLGRLAASRADLSSFMIRGLLAEITVPHFSPSSNATKFTYDGKALGEYLDAFVTPFHGKVDDAQRGALFSMLLRRVTYLEVANASTSHHLSTLIRRDEPYTLEAMKLLLPGIAGSPCNAFSEATEAAENSKREAHSFIVEQFTKDAGTIAHMSTRMTVKLLRMLNADLQVKMVAALMPHLTGSANDPNAKIVKKEVREYIEDALASGAM